MGRVFSMLAALVVAGGATPGGKAAAPAPNPPASTRLRGEPVPRVPPPRRPALPGTGVGAPLRMAITGREPDTGFATAAGAAGDVNRDGYADIFITAPRAHGGRGAVYIHYGAPRGLGTSADWEATGEAGEERCGAWAGPAGDVNGDGYADLLVAVPGPDGEPGPGGSVRLYLGSRVGLATSPARVWRSSPQFGRLRRGPVGSAGDVNGDGYSDIFLTVENDLPAASEADLYRVQVFHGGPDGPGATPSWGARSQVPLNEFFGFSTASAGDVNGDGYDDLLVGASANDERGRDSGAVYLFLGSPAGLSPSPHWTARYPFRAREFRDEAYEQFFGRVVCGAGDVNHDGFADFLVAAPYADHDDLNEGLVFAYYGSPTGPGPAPSWWVESNQPHAEMGGTLSSAGDINHDGVDDVIIGAPALTGDQICEGAAIVFLGADGGLAREPHWTVMSDHTWEGLGMVVASAGDVDGDECADVLVGAPGFLDGGRRLGVVHVYRGSPSGLGGSSAWSIRKPWLIALDQELGYLRVTGRGYYVWLGLGGALAAFAGVGWWAARRAAGAREQARAEGTRLERRRFARDLHDEVGGPLSGLQRVTGALRRGPEPERLPALADQLAQATGSLADALDRVAYRLRPDQHTPASLALFVTRQATAALGEAGIACEVRLPDAFPAGVVADAARDHWMQAVREAVTNVVRHSGTKAAAVEVLAGNGELTLVLIDSGVGLAEASAGGGGNGLVNMRERMQAVGGRLALGSPPEGGVRVELTIPVQPLSAEAAGDA